MIFTELFSYITLHTYIALSRISSKLTTLYSLSTCLFTISIFLLSIIILFITHWKHQKILTVKRIEADEDAVLPTTSLMDYPESYRSRHTTPFSSVDELNRKSVYSFYDNVPTNYENHYHVKYLRRSDIV
ncbi:unnamed protein product [Acanthoscelides obtectus]|uniref:Uncharacterized protein n=1 Tax=Acanthoscelides obtectus TaxID=200917 RepID=A0A9P0MKT5_ACAOB|nr:unnamed protein product [Acanthoscelides obtectus]CAK1666766.1 hypothetical protein AOBTE_LOCUS25475 [Acanthoscelides obtectus]